MNQSFLGEILSVMPTATDPNMGLFDSLCTIQVPDGVLGASGAPSGNFVNVAGLIPAGNIGVNLINIPCMESVPSTARVQATEVKDLAEIMSKGLRHVLLNGYYPYLETLKEAGQVRAILNGTAYEILGVEPDSQRTQTRFECQLVDL